MQVDLAELSEHVAGSRSKHPKDGVLQLQLLASWLARTFSGVSYHLAANIDKVGVNAAVSQPWGDAVEPLQKALLKCEPLSDLHMSCIHISFRSTMVTHTVFRRNLINSTRIRMKTSSGFDTACTSASARLSQLMYCSLESLESCPGTI